MKHRDARGTPGTKFTRRLALGAAALAVAALLFGAPPAAAQEQQDAWGAHFVRTSHVEGQVTIQRASEIRSEDALLNMPVIPGDRIWTGADGRAELQLADGMLLRMDYATKLDTEALGVPGDQENDVTVLRLWSGSAILNGGLFDSAAKTLQVDTPAASAFILEEGLTRIDIDTDGATVISVYRGLVEVVALNSSVLVRAGQRTVVGAGYPPEEPFTFNTTELDDFGYWSDERDQRYSANYSENYVDGSISSYTYDFTDYGNWFYVSYYDTYCWRPYVGYGWRPYSYGYWSWYPWGYYWYSWEPWGWACYHYGRWDWIPGYGWAWIPGDRWSGGWVRWGLGADYVGWAPLDYHDRAATVTYDQRGSRQGLAVREGRPLTVNSPDGTIRTIDANSWTFARQDALSAAGRSDNLLGYEDVSGREPMKLLDTPLAVPRKYAGNPAPALKEIFRADGYGGGTPEQSAAPSGLTATGRRYAATGGKSTFTNTDLGAYRSRSGGSAGVVTRPSAPASSFSESRTPPRGSAAIPPRTREKSYSKQIYDNVQRPPSRTSVPHSSSRSSIPPRSSTRSSSGPSTPPSSRPPTTRRATPPSRSTARPPQRSTSRPSSPSKPSGRSMSRPSRPSSPSSSGRSAPSRPSGSSGRSSKSGKKG